MRSILELRDYHLQKNIFNNKKDSYNEALYKGRYKNELEYLDANKHEINRSNETRNKGHNNRKTIELLMWM